MIFLFNICNGFANAWEIRLMCNFLPFIWLLTKNKTDVHILRYNLAVKLKTVQGGGLISLADDVCC